MPIPDQIALLCTAIEDAARKEVEGILEKARARADEQIEKVRSEVNSRLHARIDRERQEAAVEARRITDAAELRARQLVLKEKKRILSSLKESAVRRLRSIRSEPGYKGLLISLAAGGIRQLQSDTCIVQVNSQDMGVMDSGVLASIASETGRKVRLADKPASMSGGCRVFSEDMRQMVDCSFETLLNSAEPLLMELLSEHFL